MRILMWLNMFLPAVGGVETLAANLTAKLQQRGHEVTILTSFGLRELPDRDEYAGAAIYRLPFIETVAERDLRGIMACHKQVAEFVADLRPDVLHAHPTGADVMFYAHLRRSNRVPSLLTVHNNFAQRGVPLNRDMSLAQVLLDADWVTAVSEDSYYSLLESLPELRPYASIVENGIPAPDLDLAPLAWDPPSLLFAGRFVPQKRVDLIIDAFAQLRARESGARLVLAGDGVLREELLNQVRRLGLESQVLFTGQLEPDEVLPLLNESTAFVFASDYEGLPMAALEAAWMGRPIVATRAGGLVGFVQDGLTGYLVDRGDAAALARALDRLIDDRAAAERMGQRARDYVAEHYSAERMVVEYEALYESIMSSSQSGGIVR